MRRLIGVGILVVALALGSTAWATDTWRIGVILPTTGALSKNGMKNLAGVKIATEMINDAGGVLGKKVELISADAPDPQAAASEANRTAR